LPRHPSPLRGTAERRRGSARARGETPAGRRRGGLVRGPAGEVGDDPGESLLLVIEGSRRSNRNPTEPITHSLPGEATPSPPPRRRTEEPRCRELDQRRRSTARTISPVRAARVSSVFC
jgi:hypothetical protein